jgi:hypothetical protein
MGRQFSRSSARSSTPHNNNPGYAARARIEHKRACADIMAIAEEYAKINPPAPPFKCLCGAETNNLADPEFMRVHMPTVRKQVRRGGRPPHDPNAALARRWADGSMQRQVSNASVCRWPM